MPQQTKQYHFRIPTPDHPWSETELRIFTEKALGIRVPNLRVCADHCSPWDAYWNAYSAKDSIVIWEGSRGMAGKSHLLAALGTVTAISLGCDVNILGGSGEQSRNVQKYISHFLTRPTLPCFADGQSILADDPHKYEIAFKRGNTVRALFASQNAVRGPHPVRLLGDEIDSMSLDIFEAMLGQTMEKDGWPPGTVLSSTHQNLGGTFDRALELAAERNWKVFRWCYKESLEPHGWLTQAQVDKKRNEMTAAAWKSEVELQEPNPEGRAIFPEFVDRCFNNDHEWVQEALRRNAAGEANVAERVRPFLATSVEDFNDQDGRLLIIEPPMPEGDYVHGADWGRKVDFSCIPTIRVDVKPARIVAYRRGNRQPWPILANWLDQSIEIYGDSVSRQAHDATGIGDPVKGYLKHDVQDVVLTGRIRVDAFTAWIIAIESMEVQAPRIKTLYDEHKFMGRGIFGESEHPPDTFVGCALAWHARNQSRVSVL